MKVIEIIWSDFVDDNTDIRISDFLGKTLTSTVHLTHRYYEDVEKWGQADVYGFSYFPSTNSLYITLCGIAIENDFAVMEEIK